MSQPKRDGLSGVRVALLEARMGSELAELVRRYGGVVRSAPAVREAPLDCADVVAEFLTRLQTPARRVYVFLTGAGATALFEEAERQERLPFIIESLKERNDRLPGTEADRGSEAIRRESSRMCRRRHIRVMSCLTRWRAWTCLAPR